jgi:ABC-type transport system involved in cytochrome c biogenesis permease subunit
LTTIAYLVYFVNQKRTWKQVAPILLSIGLFFHLLFLVDLSEAMNRLPIGTVFEVLTSWTFIFALLYLFIELYIKDKSMGAIITPLILIFQIIASIGIDTSKTLAPQLQGLSFQVHVSFMLLAYSGFILAFIASIMHLLLAKEIHGKNLGFFFSRIPSLELLDQINSLAATSGFIAATTGMLLGMLMAIQLWGHPMHLDAKFISFVIVWAIYLFHLIVRIKYGWQGKRAAWLSIFGFAVVLVTFFVISLFFTQMHSYR